MLDSLINEKPLKVALVLSIVTIVYNIVEGIISVIFGLNDQTLALLGFGIDSFVEVILRNRYTASYSKD